MIIELIGGVCVLLIFSAVFCFAMVIDYKMEKYGLYDRIVERKYRCRKRREEEKRRREEAKKRFRKMQLLRKLYDKKHEKRKNFRDFI